MILVDDDDDDDDSNDNTSVNVHGVMIMTIREFMRVRQFHLMNTNSTPVCRRGNKTKLTNSGCEFAYRLLWSTCIIAI